MKRITATIAAALIATCASAQTPSGETLRVLPNDAKDWKKGDTLRRYDARIKLFAGLPCDMDIANRTLYRLAYVGPREGCWAPLQGGGYVLVYWNGDSDVQPSLEQLPRAQLNTDGSVTITEPNYNSKTWARVLGERYLDRLEASRASGRY